MTNFEALNLLKCNVTELSLKLGISSQAVSQWNENKIPLARAYQIRELIHGDIPLVHQSD